MKGVSEVLQLAVIVQGSRPPSSELQPLQKLDFFIPGIAAKRGILEKLLKPGLYVEWTFRFAFYEIKPLQVPESQPVVEDNLYAKSRKVNVPGLDQRIHERYAVVNGHVEDVRVQKLQNHDPRLFIASLAEPGHHAQPFLTCQLFLRDALRHIQKLLSHEPLEFAERFLLENGPYLPPLLGVAFSKNQLPKILE